MRPPAVHGGGGGHARTLRGFVPPSGEVRLESRDGRLRVQTLMGVTPPRIISGGYGGWELIARPRRVALTEWTGNEPVRQEVALLFDGWAGEARRGSVAAAVVAAQRSLFPKDYDARSRRRPATPPSEVSVEDDLIELGRMASIDWGDGIQPPLVRGFGILLPDYTWAIESLEFGDDALLNRRRQRVRQAVTVTLLQHVAADRVRVSPAERVRQRARDVAPVRPHSRVVGHRIIESHTTWTVTQTDLSRGLRGIAALYYGDAGRWPEIAADNTIRDPMRLHVGQTLRLRVNA